MYLVVLIYPNVTFRKYSACVGLPNIRIDDHDSYIVVYVPVELKIPIGVLLIRVVDLSLDIIDIGDIASILDLGQY